MDFSKRLFARHLFRVRVRQKADPQLEGVQLYSQPRTVASSCRFSGRSASRQFTQLRLRVAQIVILAGISLFGYSALAQQALPFTFSNNHTLEVQGTFAENDSGAITALTNAINSAVNTSEQDHFAYRLDARGNARLTATFTAGVVALTSKKDGDGLDFEAGTPFLFSVIGTRNETAESNHVSAVLNVRIRLTNVEEQPEVIAPYASEPGHVFYVQKSPDVTPIPTLTAAQIFRDPDRNSGAMRFKPCADDFQVDEFPDATSTSPSLQRGSTTQDVGQTGASSPHCANPSDTTNYPSVQSADVSRGGAVVNVTTTGPLIRITPIAADSAGVRRAVLTFHGWSTTPVLSDDATINDATENRSAAAYITVYVKTGVNNPPTFIATGYRSPIRETLSDQPVLLGPPLSSPNAWNATDIDGDAITYRLGGSQAVGCTMDDGTPYKGAIAVGRGCAWLDQTELGKTPSIVKVWGKNIDYETAPPSKTYTLNLIASDGYNPAADSTVPISIVVENVDEGLEFSGPINQISQLVVGRSGRTVDLNDHFVDPDGTPVTYTAQSLTPNIINVSLQGSTLTVNALGTAGFGQILITAMSGGLSSPQVIPVTVRQSNRPPEFEQSILTVQVPNPVAESQPTDYLIRLSSLRYSDPEGDSITATILNSSLFEAVVDPAVGDQTFNGEVGIRLIGRLDFETNAQHRLQIQLSDGWDTSTRTVEVIVDVGNVNEAPVVATDPTGATRTIPPQTVAVNGTGSIDVATYFTDPDRGDRLLITAVSSNPSFATVQVTGTSTVQFTGLLETGVTPP